MIANKRVDVVSSSDRNPFSVELSQHASAKHFEFDRGPLVAVASHNYRKNVLQNVVSVHSQVHNDRSVPIGRIIIIIIIKRNI